MRATGFLAGLVFSSFAFAGSALGYELFATDGGVGVTYLVNQDSGEETLLGSLDVRINDLASNTRSGEQAFWGVGFFFENRLFRIVPGSPAVIDSVELNAPERITSLAIDPISKVMYGAGLDENLYSIDPQSGDATSIGGIGYVPMSLAFDQTGRLFGTSGSVLFEINPANAAVTTIADEMAIIRIEDMASRPSDNVMFALGFGSDVVSGYGMYRVDLVTGALQLVGSSVTRPSGLAFFDFPEPGDFDQDNDGDLGDLMLWQRGASGDAFSTADLADWTAGFGLGSASPDRDGDGDIDVADLLRWQRTGSSPEGLLNWLDAFGGGSGPVPNVTAHVPEPSGLSMILLAVGWVSLRRR